MGMNPDDPKMLSKIFDRVGIEPAWIKYSRHEQNYREFEWHRA